MPTSSAKTSRCGRLTAGSINPEWLTWTRELPVPVRHTHWTTWQITWLVFRAGLGTNPVLIHPHRKPLSLYACVLRLPEPLTSTSIVIFSLICCSFSFISLKPNLSRHRGDSKLLTPTAFLTFWLKSDTFHVLYPFSLRVFPSVFFSVCLPLNHVLFSSSPCFYLLGALFVI